MSKIYCLLLCLLILTSCTNPFVASRLEIADKFIDGLKNDNPDKVAEYTYLGVDQNLNNKESRDLYVHKAAGLIKKFGLPPRDKWTIKYDNKNNFDRLLITIPIFDGYDSVLKLHHAHFILAFPPPEISDKVYRYQIVDKYDISATTPVPVIKD